ncbi:mechanosensitive ion channel domain-containing protein [Halobacterium sp. R2-5]|uniref:mechanosensitive ion channel family protein n=1 Tax=Halobacterium sp. R2-5 TaxID=2715751 RepID=UPI00142414B8|nr:mechanosensitive ion channel domain-containing protein [Halobacterium sp. R2-5]NIB99577.1 mechanosensitive ion channel [Halobacterium sp. R2-5]
MFGDVLAVASTPVTTTSEVGPDELVDVWPLAVHVAWFLAGFLVTAALGWFVVEPLIGRVVRHRNQNNPTIQDALQRYVRLVVFLVAGVVGASLAGYGDALGDSALVVAAGTLAIGIAAQSVIGSLVSGLVLVLDPEFSVGDYIEWGDYEGVVRSIQLRATRIETVDGELVTVPNTQLTSDAIVRPYGRAEQRIVERVEIDYDDDVDEAVRHVAAAAAGLDSVLDSPAPSAYVDNLAEGVVVIRVHYWLERPRPGDVLDARSAFSRAVKSRLEDAGITISPAPEYDLRGRFTVDGPE